MTNNENVDRINESLALMAIEATDLEKRLACIAQDLECILEFMPEQILNRSTPYADSIRTHFDNIKIACDIASDEAGKWNYSPKI